MKLNEYTNRHKQNILRFQNWDARRFEKGMIAEINYENIKGEVIKDYILVLNPKYKKPGEKKWKVHTLKLNYLPVKQINELADTYGIKFIPNLQRFKSLDILKLIQEMNSRTYYNRVIQKTLRKFPCYRTYLLENIKRTRLIDYKFDDKIEKKWLIDILVPVIEEDTNKRHNLNEKYLKSR